MNNSYSQNGFTLIELVTIMVIVGVISVAVLPRFFDANVFQQSGAANEVLAALRYGQKVAIAQNRAVTVTLGNAPGADSVCPAALDATNNVTCNISNTVAVPATVVTFSGLGRETGGGAVINVGGIAITVNGETGYVQNW